MYDEYTCWVHVEYCVCSCISMAGAVYSALLLRYTNAHTPRAGTQFHIQGTECDARSRRLIWPRWRYTMFMSWLTRATVELSYVCLRFKVTCEFQCWGLEWFELSGSQTLVAMSAIQQDWCIPIGFILWRDTSLHSVERFSPSQPERMSQKHLLLHNCQSRQRMKPQDRCSTVLLLGSQCLLYMWYPRF